MQKLWQGQDIGAAGQVNKEFRDLNVEELVRGYMRSEKEEGYVCIFCGKVFEDGVIYPSGPRLLSAEKAAKEHVLQIHGGTFDCLVSMDKQINGLTDIQKNIMQYFYDGKETDEICELMAISPATVRTHKHNLQKMKREAKILLALMEQLEAEDRPSQNAGVVDGEKGIAPGNRAGGFIPGDFSGNTFHPFFTQRKFD